MLSGLPAQVPPRVRGFKETSRVSCGSRALGRRGELSDSCSDDLKGKRCMCSPAARTASQGAPRSAGKGVLPVGPGGPYAWRDAAWRVAGPEGSGRWPNTQCCAGCWAPNQGEVVGGVCRGFLVTGVGQGSPKNPESTLQGERVSFAHLLGPENSELPPPAPVLPPLFHWEGGGEAPGGGFLWPSRSTVHLSQAEPGAAGLRGLHAWARLPCNRLTGVEARASLSFPAGSP